ncbi:hypothetical protein K493DRAFT_405913, partial [Basidiobolus meristosporus CBS 931.73]
MAEIPAFFKRWYKTSKTVEYLKDVSFLPAGPTPPSEGLQGILYFQGDSCTESPAANVSYAPENVTHIKHIALLKLNGCALEWKINQAQTDSAVGAIIFDDQPLDVNVIRLRISASIPVVIVSKEVGNQLYHGLTTVDSDSTPFNTTSHWAKHIQLTLIPQQRFRPGVWEITIIVASVLVFSGALVFAFLSYRRRHLSRNRGPPLYNTDAAVLKKNHLSLFPVRPWCSGDTANYSAAESDVTSSGVSNVDLANNTIQGQCESNHVDQPPLALLVDGDPLR